MLYYHCNVVLASFSILTIRLGLVKVTLSFRFCETATRILFKKLFVWDLVLHTDHSDQYLIKLCLAVQVSNLQHNTTLHTAAWSALLVRSHSITWEGLIPWYTNTQGLKIKSDG